MLKVLHLISGGDTGGAKTHVLSLIKQLQKDIQVKIICFMEGDFLKEANEMGINIDVIKQRNRFDLKVVGQISNIIKTEGFDIVHSHGARANFISSFIKKRVNVPCITTMHSDYLHDFKGNIYKYIVFTTLNKKSLRKFDYYIAVSEEFKNMLISRGFKKEKIFTVYNGVDFNRQIIYKEKKDYLKSLGVSIPEDGLLIGIIARLHPVKGHKVLLNSAVELLKNHSNVHFLLAGDGEERKNLEEQAEKLNLVSRIHFLGFVSDVYSFINAIDINVLTSYTESFPYALLEGAFFSKATVATAVGGIPKLLINRETGYLVEAGNSKDLEKKLRYLIDNKEDRKRVGKNLYQHASQNYSLENLGDEHIKIYNKILRRQENEAY